MMKNLKSIFLLLCLINFVSISHAQEKAEIREKSITTTIQFLNGNTYVKPNNGHWLKLNDGGFAATQKSTQKQQIPNNKSGNDGKWVVSDYNKNYDFYSKNIPHRMDNFKDSSIIIAGHLFEEPPSNGSIFINRSTNRGKSWHQIYKIKVDFLTLSGIKNVQHPSPAHIIAIAEKFVKDSVGNFERAYTLMTSSDTANSWSVNDSIFADEDVPYNLDFSGKYGIIRIEKPDTTFLLYSKDFGSSWQNYNLPADLKFSYGSVLENGSILLADKYTNNKLGYIENIQTGNWQYESLPDTCNSRFINVKDKNIVWCPTPVASGTGDLQRNFITGTKDGGKTWNTALNVFEDSTWYSATGLYRIDFANKEFGAAVGSAVSYFTEDGGLTWENKGFYDTLITLGSQVMFYYYNPVSEKRLLISLLNKSYIMKYEFEESTGLTERKNIESRLKVYPNPAKNTLFLELPKELAIKNGFVTVLSVDGKEVGSFSFNNSNNGRLEVPINSLPKGSYILQLRSNDYVGSKLFVKD